MQDGTISPLRAFFRNKWVRIILVIDAVALLAVIGFLIWNATKVSTIAFNITPVDATISINGNTYYSNGQYSITPGTYNISISHEGMETKTLTVDIAPHHVVSVATFLKTADNNFEFYELKENYESNQKLAAIASAKNNITTDNDNSAEDFILKFQKAYELSQKVLPIEYYDYEKTDTATPIYTTTKDITINYSNDNTCTKILCLKATIRVGDKSSANMIIEEKGLDINQYEVIYEESLPGIK